MRTNNLIPAYALSILNNWHECGTAEETLELWKPCNKGTRMNFWDALYMQAYHQHNILIEKQQVDDINPLYDLAYTSHGLLGIP
jgi:CTP:phosphocholine cytidylyltransferase-like protein